MSECERFVAPSVKEGDRLGLYTQFQGLGMPSPASFCDTSCVLTIVDENIIKAAKLQSFGSTSPANLKVTTDWLLLQRPWNLDDMGPWLNVESKELLTLSPKLDGFDPHITISLSTGLSQPVPTAPIQHRLRWSRTLRSIDIQAPVVHCLSINGNVVPPAARSLTLLGDLTGYSDAVLVEWLSSQFLVQWHQSRL
jgi:hypothetical protein